MLNWTARTESKVTQLLEEHTILEFDTENPKPLKHWRFPHPFVPTLPVFAEVPGLISFLEGSLYPTTSTLGEKTSSLQLRLHKHPLKLDSRISCKTCICEDSLILWGCWHRRLLAKTDCIYSRKFHNDNGIGLGSAHNNSCRQTKR